MDIRTALDTARERLKDLWREEIAWTFETLDGAVPGVLRRRRLVEIGGVWHFLFIDEIGTGMVPLNDPGVPMARELIDGDATFVLGRRNAAGGGFSPFSSINHLRDSSLGGPENAREFTEAVDGPDVAHGLIARSMVRLLTLTGPRFDGQPRFPTPATPATPERQRIARVTMSSVLGDINYL